MSNRQCLWSVDNCVALDKQCFCSHSLNCAHVFLFVRAQRLHCPVFKVFTLRKYERGEGGISRSSTRQVVHRQEAGVSRSSRKETNSAGGNFSEASTLIACSLGTDNCSKQGINVHLRDFQSCSTYRWWRWLDINSDTNLMQPEMVLRQAAGVWQTLPSKCDKNWNKNQCLKH